MARRRKSPWMTLALFLAVLGLGYTAYEFVIVRRFFSTETKTFVPREQLENIRAAVLDTYEKDACLLGVGPLHYRGRDDAYRLDIFVADGCTEQARKMCEDISYQIQEMSDRKAQVWAIDGGQQVVARYLP